MLLGGQSSPVLPVVSHLAQVHTPSQLNWITRSGLDFGLALFGGCPGLVVQFQIVPPFRSSFPAKHTRAWSVSIYSIDTDLNYGMTVFFIRTGSTESQQSYYLEKNLPTFLKVQNRQLGTRLVSGYIFEYGNCR